MARRDYYDDPDAPKANSVVPAVTAVVRDDQGRVLLIHRTDNDRWALPGGGLEIGENVASAAIREVLEETGISIDGLELTGVYSDPKHVIAYDNGEVRQQFALCVRARPIGGTLHGSDEARDVRWVPAAQLETLNIHPSTRLRIDHALRPSGEAPFLG